MTTLEVIIAEFQRQVEESKVPVGYFDDTNPRDAILDGHFDLEALAAAIERKVAEDLGVAGLTEKQIDELRKIAGNGILPPWPDYK